MIPLLFSALLLLLSACGNSSAGQPAPVSPLPTACAPESVPYHYYPGTTIEMHFEQALGYPLVLEGTILSTSPVPEEDHAQYYVSGYYYDLEINKIYRGEYSQSVIRFTSTREKPADLIVGKRYIVFLHADEQGISPNRKICYTDHVPQICIEIDSNNPSLISRFLADNTLLDIRKKKDFLRILEEEYRIYAPLQQR